ncbi:hypothetical protein LSAT2_004304 [Lamellibrachia satsuma]|nr:hypothetical protein LSAT2_004304 [Lamellibrachia satsuma]
MVLFTVLQNTVHYLSQSTKKTGILLRDVSSDRIAVDWVAANLYYTSLETHAVWACTLKEGVCTPVINDGVDKPRALVLYPSKGLMFWSDWGHHPFIQRSWMDGTHGLTIVRHNLAWPNGLTIDYVLDQLYWVDARMDMIQSADFSGSKRRTVASNLYHPFSIVVFENYVFWSDWAHRSVMRANKFTGLNQTVIQGNLHKPMDVKIKHPVRQPAGVNHCDVKKITCSHLCLLTPGGATCACPIGMKLSLLNLTQCISGSPPFQPTTLPTTTTVTQTISNTANPFTTTSTTTTTTTTQPPSEMPSTDQPHHKVISSMSMSPTKVTSPVTTVLQRKVMNALPQSPAPPEDVANPSTVVPPKWMTNPSPIVPPKRMTNPSTVDPPKRITNPSTVDPPKWMTNPSPIVPPKRMTNPSTVDPPKWMTNPSPIVPPKRMTNPSTVDPPKWMTNPSPIVHPKSVIGTLPSPPSRKVTPIHNAIHTKHPPINPKQPTVNSEQPHLNTEHPPVHPKHPQVNPRHPVVNNKPRSSKYPVNGIAGEPGSGSVAEGGITTNSLQSDGCSGCLNGGTCLYLPDGSYQCSCLPEYSGPNCSDLVDPIMQHPLPDNGGIHWVTWIITTLGIVLAVVVGLVIYFRQKRRKQAKGTVAAVQYHKAQQQGDAAYETNSLVNAYENPGFQSRNDEEEDMNANYPLTKQSMAVYNSDESLESNFNSREVAIDVPDNKHLTPRPRVGDQ